MWVPSRVRRLGSFIGLGACVSLLAGCLPEVVLAAQDAAPDVRGDLDAAEGSALHADAPTEVFTAVDTSTSTASDASSPCPMTRSLCDGACVDLQNNLRHCGACGRACTSVDNREATCVAGACGTRCRPGTIAEGQGCVGVAAPRPIWPANHAWVTSRLPFLRWALSNGDGAEAEFCADRECTRTLQRVVLQGISSQLPAPLPSGVVFWRLRGVAAGSAGTAVSPTWQMTVPPRDATTSTHWGINFDFNGDGRTDLAVGDPTSSRVYLYPGTSSGLASSPLFVIQGPSEARLGTVIAPAGDLDGDGFCDLLLGAEQTRRVYLWRGAPSGGATTLNAFIDGETDFGATAMGVGDINGDGYPDAVLGSQRGLALHLGDGSGLTRAGLPLPSGGMQRYIAHGDFNGDRLGDLDIVGTDGTSHATYLGRDALRGPLSAARAMSLSSLMSFSRLAGDIDGDGLADLAMAGRSALLLLPAALHQQPIARPLQDVVGVVGAVGVDAERDGYFDLFGAVGGRRSALVYRARLAGLDTTPQEIALGREAAWFAAPFAGDFNGDGYGDVAAVLGASPGEVIVFLGSPSGFATTPSQTLALPFKGFPGFF